jgi:hypothetical protein
VPPDWLGPGAPYGDAGGYQADGRASYGDVLDGGSADLGRHRRLSQFHSPVHFVWKVTDENNIQGGVIMKLSLWLDLGRWEGEMVAATSAARRRRPTSARERDPGQSYASTAIDLPRHSVGGAAGVKVVFALP